jgi:hypothetical protein
VNPASPALLFGHVKPEHIVAVHIEGCRKLATVTVSVERMLLCGEQQRPVPVAVTRGNMQFRLDTGVALVPPHAWLVQRLTPSEAKRARLPWAFGEESDE